MYHAVDSKEIPELHLLLLRWHRRDVSTCPLSKRLLSVPVTPLACHMVARTEFGPRHALRSVGGRGQEIRKVNKRQPHLNAGLV